MDDVEDKDKLQREFLLASMSFDDIVEHLKTRCTVFALVMEQLPTPDNPIYWESFFKGQARDLIYYLERSKHYILTANAKDDIEHAQPDDDDAEDDD